MSKFNELSQQTQTAIGKQTKKQIFASGNWELSGKQISNMLLPKDALSGSEESFFYTSQILGAMLQNVNVEDIGVMDLINMVMASSAIENADTRAATFFRDTGGGKPIDKIQKSDNALNTLSDDELDRILAGAQVIDDD